MSRWFVLPSCIISSLFKFIGKQLDLEKGLHKVHDYFHGITVPLNSTEVSTAGVTRSWRLEFLQQSLTEASLSELWRGLEASTLFKSIYSLF